MTVKCVAISGYRSLHDLCFAPGPLTVITGGNGVGKSNVYRALELLHAAAHGRLASSFANEGGFESAAWAGPESVRTDAAKRRAEPIVGTRRKGPVRIHLGLALEVSSFEMVMGLIPPSASAFDGDPDVKEEWLWRGPPRRTNRPWLVREGPAARGLDADGRWRHYTPLDGGESILAQVDEPHLLPELFEVRRTLRAFRFYHAFRTDSESPLRAPRIGVRTNALASNGEDLAAALQTILEVGDGGALLQAVEKGLRGTLELRADDRFEVGLRVPGLLRRLGARELSDGSLKYLALLAALFSPRPAPLLVFNEPEASLHPELLAPLAEALVLASVRSSVWVISHAQALVAAMEAIAGSRLTRIDLERDEEGATLVKGQRRIDRPAWP